MDASFSKIILEGDNVNVMKAISSPSVNLFWLGLIYEDIRCIAARLRAFTAVNLKF